MTYRTRKKGTPKQVGKTFRVKSTHSKKDKLSVVYEKEREFVNNPRMLEGFYLGVLGATNDPDIRSYVEPEYKSLKEELGEELSLNEILNTREWDGYSGDVFNLQHRIINAIGDPEKITHQDVIYAERDFINSGVIKLTEQQKEELHDQLDKVEQWHEKNKSIDDVVIDLG